MIKTLSCTALQSSVYLAPNELRHCCKRFFYKGKLKGDVKIFSVKNGEKINLKKILMEKKNLIQKINRNEENPCTGCPHLVSDNWDEIENLKIKHLSIEAHSICNMKCSYCSDVYYGGKKPNYNLEETLNNLIDENAFDKNVDIAWGGGEPLLLENFEKLLENLSEKIKPFDNMIFTNAIKYSKKIEYLLKYDKAKITTSIDAGNIKTFKEIRGVKAFDKVFENLRKYYNYAKKNIIIKYILTEGNYDKENLDGFLNKIKEYGLQNCTFQISANFKIEDINQEIFFNTLYLYKNLKEFNKFNVIIDYHLKPKIKKYIREIYKSYNIELIEKLNLLTDIKKLKNSKLIIWGAGDTGRELLNKNSFLKLFNIQVKFFVDKYKNKKNSIGKIQIKEPKNIIKNSYNIIIASTAFNEEIYKEIISMGVDKERIIDDLFL
jgi:molybdenum cofactor biosynthesis enzyme MoaA